MCGKMLLALISTESALSQHFREPCFMPGDPTTQLTRNPIVSRMGTPSATLDSLLSDCIDQVLSDLIGNKAKEALYDYMERNYALSREGIPRDFGKFFALTEEICGSASKTIARCIMRRLWERLGWSDMPDFVLSDFLDATRARMAKEAIERQRPA
jgi:hypothetical protein